MLLHKWVPPHFPTPNELKWTVALLIVDDIKATDGAFGKILLWAREAASAQYSFYPQGGDVKEQKC